MHDYRMMEDRQTEQTQSSRLPSFSMHFWGTRTVAGSWTCVGFPMAQWVKSLPAMQETQETRVLSLSEKDPLEEEMATHCSILAWRNPMDRGAWWATVHGVAKSQTGLSDLAHRETLENHMHGG